MPARLEYLSIGDSTLGALPEQLYSLTLALTCRTIMCLLGIHTQPEEAVTGCTGSGSLMPQLVPWG